MNGWVFALLWYGLGIVGFFVARFFFHAADNYRRPHPITIGTLVLAFLSAFLGPICLAVAFFGFIIYLVEDGDFGPIKRFFNIQICDPGKWWRDRSERRRQELAQLDNENRRRRVS